MHFILLYFILLYFIYVILQNQGVATSDHLSLLFTTLIKARDTDRLTHFIEVACLPGKQFKSVKIKFIEESCQNVLNQSRKQN